MAAKKKTKKKTTKKTAARGPTTTKKKKKAVVVAKKKSAPAKKKKKKAAAATAAATAAPKKEKKTKKKKAEGLLPSKEDEARFWSLIEDAWATQGAEVNAARHALATREPGDDDVDTSPVDEALEDVLDSLRAVFSFEDFSKEELIAMDRVLERKLYDIDRSEIQEVTDGSDDGFLYARGFIVILGKAFYDAVNKNPQMAIDDLECEQMCYLPAEVYQERFGGGEGGDYPETGSNISRESASNPDGWSND